MPEPTLMLALKDLAGEIGRFLGYGRGADNGDPAWDSGQQSAINSCLASGLRQFYWPPPVPPATRSHNWSFLRPTASMTLAQGVDQLQLPDDFGGIEGSIAVSGDNGVVLPVRLIGEGRIRQMYATTPTATGRPAFAAIAPGKGTGPFRSQRFALLVYPIADQDYTLSLEYYVSPDCLTGQYPWAYGGPPHAETILESCLAIAEQRLDNRAEVHTMLFQQRLAASISMDCRYRPQTLGYNGDRSDDAERMDRLLSRPGSSVTYNGVQY